MSRSGNPYDNARAESFIKTLKCEEVYLRQYRDAEEARASIGHFIGRSAIVSDCIRRWAISRPRSSSRQPKSVQSCAERQ